MGILSEDGHRYKYGYIDQTGAWVIEPKFLELGDFSENGLAPAYVLQDNGWYYGYIDKTGNMVIEPQFEFASDFGSSGFAQVNVASDETECLYQYIDEAGNIFSFDWVSSIIDHDRVLVSIDDKYGYIDKTGTLIIEPQFSQAFDFYNGRAAVLIGDKFGFIDTSGAVVIEPQFDDIYECYDGLYTVQVGDKFGLIDPSGAVVIEPQFDDIDNVCYDGLYRVQVGDKWGFINQDGDFIIEPQFDGVWGFHNGLAPARVGDKFGYINKAGDWVIEPQFDVFAPLDELLYTANLGYFADNGLAYIDITGNYGYGQESKYGYIDKTGAWVIEPQFDFATEFVFDNGLAFVGLGNKEGFINETGTFLNEWTNDLDLPTSCWIYYDVIYTLKRRDYVQRVGVYDLSGNLIYEYNSNNS